MLPRVKFDASVNLGWNEETVSLAVKALNTTGAGWMNTPNARGTLPTAIGEPITVLVAVAITDTVLLTSLAT